MALGGGLGARVVSNQEGPPQSMHLKFLHPPACLCTPPFLWKQQTRVFALRSRTVLLSDQHAESSTFYTVLCNVNMAAYACWAQE